MIIGISGKIGSGKDIVGKIIQYLIYCNDNKSEDEFNYTVKEWIDDYNSGEINQFPIITKDNWQIVKFADALKDIVCILTGCTREQLEDIDFKNSYLSEEWIYGIHEECGFKTLLSFPYDVNKYRGVLSKSYTYRELLQKLGTDLLRNQLHENVWCNALFSKYKNNNWVITDCRFENEANAIKDRNGIIIRVNRVSDSTKIGCDTRHRILHSSEIALDNYKFDYIITNDGLIEDLIASVKLILIFAGIIQ